MATAKWSAKDPQDVRDYFVDFTSLLADGETVTVAAVTIAVGQFDVSTPYTDLAKVAADFTGPVVRVRVSGGTPASYAIQYHVTTSSGQQFDLTKTLVVKERTA